LHPQAVRDGAAAGGGGQGPEPAPGVRPAGRAEEARPGQVGRGEGVSDGRPPPTAMEPSTPANQPAEAASVLLAPGARSPEALLVRRGAALRFSGGFWAFPGGKLDPRDAAIPVVPSDPEDGLSARRAAAARELFEETGVLIARADDGGFPPLSPDLSGWRR